MRALTARPGPPARVRHATLPAVPAFMGSRQLRRVAPPMRRRVGWLAAAARDQQAALPQSPPLLNEAANADTPLRWSWPALTALATTLATPLAAAAADKVAYDAAAGSDFLKNAAGAAYVVLLVVFAARLLRKRATTATSQRFASAVKAQESLDATRAAPRPTVRATPARAALGALQAGVVAALLFALCTKLDAFFDGVDLPDGYTQRNIAVTLRTISRGLSYLLTFIYAANAVGLGGLAVQLVFYPEPEEEDEESDDDEEDEGVTAASPSTPPEKIE